DWNLAAGRAASQVLGVAPNWLIFVEGIGASSQCSSGQATFWGENLAPLTCTPSLVPANRLVLSPHSYGPDVFVQPYHKAKNFPSNMPAIWDGHWGFAIPNAPMVLGEFGGKYGEGDSRDRAWQNALVDYLIGKRINSGFYWSWNPNSSDTGGILRDD
uniref:glycoside hydrolase family 5 protein n=1 Tax=Nevskia sp. TaxID=1929292 RepID=UPI0025D382F0